MLTVKDLNKLYKIYSVKNTKRKDYDSYKSYKSGEKFSVIDGPIENIVFPIEYNGEKYYIISKLIFGSSKNINLDIINLDIKGYDKFIFFNCTFDLIFKSVTEGKVLYSILNTYPAKEVYIYNCTIKYININTEYLNITKCNIYSDTIAMELVNLKVIDLNRVNHFEENNNNLDFNRDFYSNLIDTTIEKTPNKYCPPIGQSFIGYKKVYVRVKGHVVKMGKAIVELEVPADAIRYDAMFLGKDQYKKIRVNKAIVKDIIVNTMANIYPIEELEFVSSYDHNFKYYIGQEISLEGNSFDYNRNVVCGKGIHLFMTIDEALNYVI